MSLHIVVRFLFFEGGIPEDPEKIKTLVAWERTKLETNL